MGEIATRSVEAEGNHHPTRGREAEWSRRFAALTLAWLAAETVTGLALWLAPFSVPMQWTVVVHAALGLVFLVPALVYQWQHLRFYWPRPGGAVKWMGYLASAATLLAILSGLVLTVQAAWARASPGPGTASISSPPSRSSPSPRRTCW